MAESSIDRLLATLGYDKKFGVSYYPLVDFTTNESLSPVARLVERINQKSSSSSIHGSYVVRTDLEQSDGSSLRPIVFVATATTVDEAREIHRSLWNSSSAPFIIIRLPDQIRVYTGFDYDQEQANHGFLEEIEFDDPNLFGDYSQTVLGALKKYSAEAVDSGTIWQILKNTSRDRFDFDNKVDKRLLRNLLHLEQQLNDKLRILGKTNCLPHIHAVIGKYVYFWYLKDRGILTERWAANRDIDLDSALNKKANLAELIKLSEAIEHRFEGRVFPFPDGFEQVFDDGLVNYVARVFLGDEPGGQTTLFDFGIYDFSYIPVETLSYIYEQFLRSQGLTKQHGAVYTPESLADYLINEMSSVYSLQSNTKVLDPCCGSGIFLVLTYQYLIELELHRRNLKHLLPAELRGIMERCIHGIEFNLEACFVTEFSLILILLNYIEPPDLDKYDDFRFPNLHGKNVFHGDFFDPKKEFFPDDETFPQFFDWVIGNPPWKSVDREHPEDKNAYKWIRSNLKTRPIGNNRIEEAFAWRAGEFVSGHGVIGFVMPAQPLFNEKDKKFRKEFFRKNEVRRITNFSNFHYLLFKVDVSAITIVYRPVRDGAVKEPIWHYSPFVANQIMAQLKKGEPTRPVWVIVINKNEIQMIPHTEAETGEALVWKVAFWGTREHARTLSRLRNSYRRTLKDVVKERRWSLHEGLRLRHASERGKSTEPLDSTLFKKFGADLTYFDGTSVLKSAYRFNVPQQALKALPEELRNVPTGSKSGLSLIGAPHLVLNAQYVIYSDRDFIIKNLYGLSAPSEHADELRAIAAYLGSRICKFLLFFLSPQWGIHRRKLNKRDWEQVPLPSLSPKQNALLADLHRRICLEEQEGTPKEKLQQKLDKEIEGILRIPESVSILIRDFFDVNITLDKTKKLSGGSNTKAVKRASDSDLKQYAFRLRNELDQFTSVEKHLVTIIVSNETIVCKVNLVSGDEQQVPHFAQSLNDHDKTFSATFRGIGEEFSQWVYIQRELRFFDSEGETFYIYKSPRLINWTESEAIADANDLFMEAQTSSAIEISHSFKDFPSYEKNAPRA